EFWVKQALKWFTPVGLPSYALAPFKFWKNFRDPTATHIPVLAKNPEAGLFQSLRKAKFVDGGQFDFRGLRERDRRHRSSTLSDRNARAPRGSEATLGLERDFGGFVRYRLDWILVKPPGVSEGGDKHSLFEPFFPETLRELNDSVPEGLSDHAAITADV